MKPNMIIEITTGEILHWARADLSALLQPGQEMCESPVEELPGPIQDCYHDKTGNKILYLKTDADKLAAGKITQQQIDDEKKTRDDEQLIQAEIRRMAIANLGDKLKIIKT